MNFEFDELAQKIERLADLTKTLRAENAELRRNAGALHALNLELQQRMDEAQRRVSALIALLPIAAGIAEEAV